MIKSQTHKTRIAWIDICRGIGIIFVLYGHVLASDIDRYLIYAFHMPLFFFLSGIVFKPEQTKYFLRFVIKAAKAILIPYAIFAFLTFVLWYYHAHNPSIQAVDKQLYGIFYGNGNNGFLSFNVALWFLPCLFVTKIAFGLVTKYVQNNKFIIISIILFSLIGYGFSLFLPKTKLPFGIETAFTAFAFFGAGYLWTQQKRLTTLMQKRGATVFLVCFIFYCIVASVNYFFSGLQVDMRVNRLNNYALFYLSAFSGIFTFIAFSMVIGKNAFLEYIGKQSLILFACHYLLFTYFTDFITASFRAEIINSMKVFFPMLYTALSLYIILFGLYLMKRVKIIYAVGKFTLGR